MNRIPSTAFDPASVAFEKAFPTYPWHRSPREDRGPSTTTAHHQPYFYEYIARVDHAFNANDHLFGHYYPNQFQQAADYNPTDLASYSRTSIPVTRTRCFPRPTPSPYLLNNLILNYQREIALRGGPPGSPDITAFGVKISGSRRPAPIWPASVTGYFGVVLRVCRLDS